MSKTADELRARMLPLPAEDRAAMPIPTERLAYWFFRVNGFLTIENFVVHREEGGSQGTDADLLGVRFPHRQELRLDDDRFMRDYPHFDAVYAGPDPKPLLALVEVKADECALNGPWTQPRRGNMQRVLRAAGLLAGEEEVARAAARLYDNPGGDNRGHNAYDGPSCYVRMYAVGDRVPRGFALRHPNVVTLTWRQILAFLHRRFRDYQRQKADHKQWDDVGRALWDAALARESVDDFVADVRGRLVHGEGLAPCGLTAEGGQAAVVAPGTGTIGTLGDDLS
jgi:hypothetical protein